MQSKSELTRRKPELNIKYNTKLMAKRLLIVFILIGLCVMHAAAQEPREQTISGNVQDADLKEPMGQRHGS